MPTRLRTLIVVVTALAAAACPTPPPSVDAGTRAIDAGTMVDAGAKVFDTNVVAAVDAGTPARVLGAPDDSALWEAMRVRAGVANVDALRACTSTDQCATVRHFTRCCAALSLNATHARVVEKARASLKHEHQTTDELKLCQIASCSGVLPPSTCAAGRCVVDGERALWMDVARVTSTENVDALRACTSSDDCAIVPHPTRCCQPAAVARAFVDVATEAQASLMPPDEAKKCAIKDCAIRGDAVCVEALCRVGHR